ncbi:MAG: 50S ribosomal protein L32, partial [Rhizobiales bacterium]|nr:50S ribosomal protein L32 [Hyphomicrobiales bacterium]
MPRESWPAWAAWPPISLASSDRLRYKPARFQGARLPVCALLSWSYPMAVPRRKTSPSRRGMRRSGHKLATVTW